MDITIVLHGLNIHIPYTKFLDTFMIQIFIFSCGPTFFLIYVVKAWACFVHAYIHTWCLFGRLIEHCKVAKKSPYHHTNIPHGSVHACHMLCTVYHGKWHVSTDANSVATHQFQVPVYMVWVQIHMVSKQGYSWLFLSHSVYQFKLRQWNSEFLKWVLHGVF